MVFDRIINKFKQRNNSEDTVIVSGLNIRYPTYRLFYRRYPFYDAETDTIDFYKLEEYISNLRQIRGRYFDEECKECYEKTRHSLYYKKYCEFVSEFESNLTYVEKVELENLRKLFMILTGESEYYYSSDMNNFIKIVKDYREQYRNLDETISNLENKIQDKNIQISELKEKVENLSQQSLPSSKKYAQALIDKDQLILERRQEIDSLNQEIASLKKSLNNKEKEYDKLQTDFSELKNSSNPEPKKQKLSQKETHKVSRNSKEYKRYKKKVLKRDKICQCCGSSENIHVHHPLTFNAYNHLGADTNNGIVLCEDCHNEYHHRHGYKKECNPVTLAQFLRDYGKPQQVIFDEDYLVSEDLVTSAGGK